MLPAAEVLRVAQQLLVVRADVEDDRERLRGRHAADERVERELADRDPEAADALVADAEDALAVRHDDDVHVRVRAVAEELGDRVAHVEGDEEAARAPVDVAELLARLGDDGRVDDRHHLLDVREEEAVEEDLVRVLQGAELDVPAERRRLLEIGLVGADELVVDRLDLVREEAVEPELRALLRREGRALVPRGGLQELHPAQTRRGGDAKGDVGIGDYVNPEAEKVGAGPKAGPVEIRRNGRVAQGIPALPAQLWMALFWAARDDAGGHEVVPEVRHAARELAVVLRARRALGDQVGDRAAVREERVRHARVAAVDDDRGREVRVRAAVGVVGDPVEIGVREPADVAQERQRQVRRRLHGVRQVAVDVGLHELVRERARVPVRDRGPELHGVGRVEERAASRRVGAGPHRRGRAGASR